MGPESRVPNRLVLPHAKLLIRETFVPCSMTYVVTETCIKCKYTDCVDVCPVDCFREGPNMLVIDPDECIDCAVCIPECPVNAIYAEEDVPPEQLAFIKLNVELSQQAATDPARLRAQWVGLPFGAGFQAWRQGASCIAFEAKLNFQRE